MYVSFESEMQGMPRSPSNNSPGYRLPSQVGLHNFEEVLVMTEDRTNIRGWMMYSNNPKSSPTIIYYHENAGSICHCNEDIGFRLPFVKQMVRTLQCNVLLVAYRGFSDSDGSPT